MSNQNVYTQMNLLLQEATKRGPGAIDSHFKALAFSIGAQAAVMSDPNEMPTVINDLISEFGRGVQAGMLEEHGVNGRFGVQVHAVNVKR